MSDSLQIETSIEEDRWLESLNNCKSIVEETVLATVTAINLQSFPFEISIVLGGDNLLQELNAKYRQKDKPTNVLSFPQIEDITTLSTPPAYLTPVGDVFIALETTLKEAAEMEIPLEHHFRHLLVHGTLHLFGYDHIDEEEAKEMESLEISILKRFEIKNPYLVTEGCSNG